MPSLWYRLSERIREKIASRRNKKQHKHKGRGHGAKSDITPSNNKTDKIRVQAMDDADQKNFSIPKSNDNSRPKLTNMFPDLDISGEGLTNNRITNNNNNNNNEWINGGGMLAYVPKMTQELCMSHILYGQKFEDCLERCRSDLDLNRFGSFQHDYKDTKLTSTPCQENSPGTKINIRQWRHSTDDVTRGYHGNTKDSAVDNSYLFCGDDELLY